MRKQIYEIMDDLRNNPNKKQILYQNNSQLLQTVLECVFNPDIKFFTQEYPKLYTPSNSPPEMGHSSLETEIRRLYIFIEGHPGANGLTQKKKEELLLTYLEGLEPREAEVILDIFRKDLRVPGLNREIVKSVFPNLMV